jgi:hypothetical protein
MEKQVQAVALIPRSHADRSHWFALWQPERESFDFVTARFGEGESPRDVLDREVSKALGLPSNEFLVANMAQINLEVLEVAACDQMPQPLCIAFYLIQLYSRRARQAVNSHPAGRWVTGQELHAGCTADGRAINPSLTRLLRGTEVVQPW